MVIKKKKSPTAVIALICAVTALICFFISLDIWLFHIFTWAISIRPTAWKKPGAR